MILEKNPGLHGVQKVASGMMLYLPNGHKSQSFVAWFIYKPCLQTEKQSVALVDLSPDVFLFSGQFVQEELPYCTEYLLRPQGEQAIMLVEPLLGL